MPIEGQQQIGVQRAQEQRAPCPPDDCRLAGGRRAIHQAAGAQIVAGLQQLCCQLVNLLVAGARKLLLDACHGHCGVCAAGGRRHERAVGPGGRCGHPWLFAARLASDGGQQQAARRAAEVGRRTGCRKALRVDRCCQIDVQALLAPPGTARL